MLTLPRLEEALEASWAADTAFDASEWSPDNPARGQCVATSLVVQYFFGGDLQKLETIFDDHPETHYRNVLPTDGVIDFTCRQYPVGQELSSAEVALKGFASIREKRLAEPITRQKYKRLLRRVERHLSSV